MRQVVGFVQLNLTIRDIEGFGVGELGNGNSSLERNPRRRCERGEGPHDRVAVLGPGRVFFIDHRVL